MTTYTSVLGEKLSEQLRGAVRGDVIQPDGPGYEDARKVYNAMHDKCPAAIVRAVDAGDIIATVDFAREQDLRLAVRGGSHGVAGYGTCDGGVVLDLGSMRGVRVDPEARTARAEGGCTWADLNHATHAFGLATTGGVVSSTGVGGLTTGGGMGYLARRCGLACDNLISADVVTADGSFVTCTAERDADLLWSVRGGGGNFGVLASLQYRLHPVADILGGPTFYPLDPDVMRRYRELIADSGEEFSALLVVALGPPLAFLPERWHGRPLCGVVTCWTGPEDQDDRIRARLAALGPVIGQSLGRMPYPVINTLFDELLPAGLFHYWKGTFSQGLPDGAIDAYAEYGATTPTIQSATVVFPIDGACHRVGLDESAFAYRDADYSTALSATLLTRAECEDSIGWVRAFAAALEPHSSAGAYVNFMDVDDQDRARNNYRQNYDRLTAMKRRYDPGNLFRLNHNITPDPAPRISTSSAG
ncbi:MULTISPECIES: FAD-binding oxidoreductase [unclassified Streptomyces]|uniref:FAD-binding oxidoreductase n=1 Tax=unclassified Streptomyces TaxID=2593676 RepID=UPI001BE7710E|nr:MULTISPECIES: FAD-binding oxidoreductase [unclassified Streptomyces]MBT2403499.1 FAD-binding oxidoreductase [Streptomyces sp. ISL-21]MBT2458994.1 FAD-binding oxidoreductase [Streptomyces sp. ISL-86]MBT2612862.1 FAD-binding oxidoreductase [Streptomyces sp. ISL-87]